MPQTEWAFPVPSRPVLFIFFFIFRTLVVSTDFREHNHTDDRCTKWSTSPIYVYLYRVVFVYMTWLTRRERGNKKKYTKREKIYWDRTFINFKLKMKLKKYGLDPTNWPFYIMDPFQTHTYGHTDTDTQDNDDLQRSFYYLQRNS